MDRQQPTGGQSIRNPLSARKKGRLYSTKEASQYLGISIWMLRELIWSDRLQVVKFGRKHYLDIRDLEAFIERYKISLS